MKKYPSMNKAVKKEWLKRLRSGQYLQGEGQLMYHIDDKPAYCCLGILQECVTGKKLKIDGKGFPDDKVLVKAGLEVRGNEMLISKSHITEVLATNNDSGKWSFPRIADWIEKYL